MDYVTFCSKFTDWLLRNTADDVFVSRRGTEPAQDTEVPGEEVRMRTDPGAAPCVCYIERRTPSYTARLTFRLDDWFARLGPDWPDTARELKEICGRFGLSGAPQPKKAGDYKKELPAKDRELFDLLRNVRAEIARENEIAPYVVFSNRTLYELCIRKPWGKEEMLAVPGIGQKNYSLYGERFLEVIRNADHGE